MRFVLASITMDGGDSFFTYLSEDKNRGVQFRVKPGARVPARERTHQVSDVAALEMQHQFHRAALNAHQYPGGLQTAARVLHA